MLVDSLPNRSNIQCCVCGLRSIDVKQRIRCHFHLKMGQQKKAREEAHEEVITVIFKNDGLGLASLRLLLQPDKAMDSLGQGAWSIACVRVALPPCVWIRFDGRPPTTRID